VWDIFKGHYVGSAQWLLTPFTQATELAFLMNVRFTSSLMAFSSLFVDVREEHAKAMQQAFEGLKRYLRSGGA
jgi:hypothetical protein